MLNGADPQLTEFGPYSYRVNITRYNIDFQEDGKFVAYREAQYGSE